MKDRLIHLHQTQFHISPAFIVRAPGRINLIGEHTDYNEGFVLPAAINKYIYVSIAPNQSDRIALYSDTYDDRFEISTSDIKPVTGWANYILGVIDQLQQRGIHIPGMDMVIMGDIPTGAGISSSAALESAVVFALDQLLGLDLARKEMALIAQAAEHTFPGVRCGIMDMWASLHGVAGHAMKLDCRTLDYELVPFDFPEIGIILFDSGVKHSLATSEYNDRRQQCEQGVAWVREKYPAVHSLRDVSRAQLDEIVKPRDLLAWTRCAYVLEENDRLQSACAHLRAGNLSAFGQDVYASHTGLRDKYNVSCKELDVLVSAANEVGVPGARMMGGGFGGCTINILPVAAFEKVTEAVSKVFETHFGRIPETYFLRIGEGAGVVG